MVFQERTELIQTSGTAQEIKKVIPHVFDNIFSLTRSQEKAVGSISERSKQVEELKQQLDELLLSWYDLLDSERKTKVQELRAELNNKQTFHELHALKERLEKIDFSHVRIDTARLIGAWNDLEESWQEKSGKRGSIREQTETIRTMIRMEVSRFEMLYRRFLFLLESLDHSDLEKSMQDFQG